MTRAELHPHRPPAALAPYVADMTAYDVVSAAPGRHRGLPTTGLTFVLPVGDPLDVAWAGRPESRARRWSCVSGLHTVAAEIRHDGCQAGLQLTLTAAGARALLGVPAAALAAELVTLEEVAPGLAALPERLAGLTGWAARLTHVEQVLLDALRRHDGVRVKAEVARAMQRLGDGAGVAETADEVGYSRRHLRELFRAEVGVGPKEYQRIARFEATRTPLVAAAQGHGSLAEVAVAAGYADQAHLTREWTALAGCPPTTWLREELPFLQESAATSAAS